MHIKKNYLAKYYKQFKATIPHMLVWVYFDRNFHQNIKKLHHSFILYQTGILIHQLKYQSFDTFIKLYFLTVVTFHNVNNDKNMIKLWHHYKARPACSLTRLYTVASYSYFDIPKIDNGLFQKWQVDKSI